MSRPSCHLIGQRTRWPRRPAALRPSFPLLCLRDVFTRLNI
ncbi:hypothetical protein L914_12156 [Phytophthora nicotianae]|uniref:Uncharacterized protein n=1 Tax=Phytophthora nicotianae TaxID=4792 RepID=W2INH4_PHYNI|nr:hypothetical protein L916_12233 [Phytophthora nicotianae]ETM42147.1 hypothetical protein L914_12156 [Phytophthora nicotianae]